MKTETYVMLVVVFWVVFIGLCVSLTGYSMFDLDGRTLPIWEIFVWSLLGSVVITGACYLYKKMEWSLNERKKSPERKRIDREFAKSDISICPNCGSEDIAYSKTYQTRWNTLYATQVTGSNHGVICTCNRCTYSWKSKQYIQRDGQLLRLRTLQDKLDRQAEVAKYHVD